MAVIPLSLLAILCFAFVNSQVEFYEEKLLHNVKPISDEYIQHLSSKGDMAHLKGVLDIILTPRVPGTRSHKYVGDFIVDHMKKLFWHVDEDRFVDNTPVGKIQFRNIIAKMNPDAERYLVLACHYDSKHFKDFKFLGATDSAVPCAMMMNLAKVMMQDVSPLRDNRVSLMFIFFDGEEAFKTWSAKDSIYGARHLAKKWQMTPYRSGTELQKIDILILLDLIGTPDPSFYSYFPSTLKWYMRLVDAEQRLARLQQLQGYSAGRPDQVYFKKRSFDGRIEDDHIPFLQRNVDVVHLIPSPFPAVWHTARDDRSALDFTTIDNLGKILRVFVAEYFALEGGNQTRILT